MDIFFPEGITQLDGILAMMGIVIVSVGVATTNTHTIITNIISGMKKSLGLKSLKNLEASIGNLRNTQMLI
tara:strand:+ start:279 stop:491 length:213 start_codon:yes stop_codon:yes gene_type:complete